MAVESTTSSSFLDSLRASGLLDEGQLAELARHPEAHGPSPAPLARLVVQREASAVRQHAAPSREATKLSAVIFAQVVDSDAQRQDRRIH